MCQHLTPLARSNDFRHIARCEHGTIHLTWDLMTVYLDDDTFTGLVQVLEKGASLTKPGKVHHESCHVFHRELGYYQVWVRNIALNLSPADFLIFTDLAQVALAELPTVKRQLSTPAAVNDPNPLLQGTVKASNNPRFSLN